MTKPSTIISMAIVNVALAIEIAIATTEARATIVVYRSIMISSSIY